MKNCIIFILSFYCFSVFGQKVNQTITKDSTSTWKLLKYDFGMTAQSIGHAYTSPLRWENKDFKKLTLITVGTFTMSLADEEVNRFFRKNRKDYPQAASDFGYRLGKPQTFFAINAGLYGVGLITKNEKIRKTSVLIISSAITAGLLQAFTKTAFGRARPSSGLGYDSFNSFSSEAFEHSLPSGHTILSITMTHAIAKQFDNIWTKVGIYSIGAITPITRMVEGAHWLTDVTVGTVLSIVVVDSIDRFLFKKDAYPNAKQPKKISWSLKLSSNQVGVVGVF